MSKASPTQRALKELKDMGFTAAIVEKWNPHAKVRQDLFGCIDLLAIHPDLGTIGVQACAGASHAARRAKSLAEPRLKTWLKVGNRFEIWSFAKRGERGKVKRWALRREEITLGEVLTTDDLIDDQPDDRKAV